MAGTSNTETQPYDPTRAITRIGSRFFTGAFLFMFGIGAEILIFVTYWNNAPDDILGFLLIVLTLLAVAAAGAGRCFLSICSAVRCIVREHDERTAATQATSAKASQTPPSK